MCKLCDDVNLKDDFQRDCDRLGIEFKGHGMGMYYFEINDEVHEMSDRIYDKSSGPFYDLVKAIRARDGETTTLQERELPPPTL